MYTWQHISWEHLTHFYHHHREDGTKPHSGLSILPKLKMEHAVLTAYSKMKVDLAAQLGDTPCENCVNGKK